MFVTAYNSSKEEISLTKLCRVTCFDSEVALQSLWKWTETNKQASWLAYEDVVQLGQNLKAKENGQLVYSYNLFRKDSTTRITFSDGSLIIMTESQY